MGRCGDHKHDIASWQNRAMAVDGGDAAKLEPADCLFGDGANGAFGHARIMLEFKRRQAAAFVAAEPGETRHSADVGAAPGQGMDFRGDVEILRLDAHRDRCRCAGGPNTHLSHPSSAETARFPAHGR